MRTLPGAPAPAPSSPTLWPQVSPSAPSVPTLELPQENWSNLEQRGLGHLPLPVLSEGSMSARAPAAPRIFPPGRRENQLCAGTVTTTARPAACRPALPACGRTNARQTCVLNCPHQGLHTAWLSPLYPHMWG